MQSNNKVSSFISGPAALVVLLAFFLPWITISCEDYDIMSATGYEMATGNIDVDEDASSEMDSEDTEGDEYLLAIPLMALLTLVIAGTRLAAKGTSQMAFIGYLIAGIIGLGAQLIEFASLQSDLSDAKDQGVILDISYKLGWWLSLLGLIAIIVAAFVAIRERDQPYPQQMTYNQPPGGYYGPY